MKPFTFMLIAGEASGDLLGAELVSELRVKTLAMEAWPTSDGQPLRTELEPRFFGAGGPHLKAAGADLALDLTEHSVIGLSDALRNYPKFRRFFRQLFQLAIQRQPDAIICIDFSGFNRRFAHAIKEYVRARHDQFHPWDPKLVQYVSPQVWASRPGRARQMAEDYDLVLSLFPFEKEWYAQRVPKLRVEFVGHPMVDRFAGHLAAAAEKETGAPTTRQTIVLLPGSRRGELRKHVPVITGALDVIRKEFPGTAAIMVLPNEALAAQARRTGVPASVPIQIGNLPEVLGQASLAIACTGTVTMECAFFGVPAVTLYKTSWATYHLAKRVVTINWLTMPNLLAGEEVFPEFVQERATPENIGRAGVELLRDQTRREAVKIKLARVVASLGGPGATGRAAGAIVELLNRPPR